MTWWSCELIWNFSYINPSQHFILGMRGREPFSSPLIYYRPNILCMLEWTATENIFKKINDADSMLNWLDTLQIYLWHLNCSDGMFMFWLQLYLLWSALCKNIDEKFLILAQWQSWVHMSYSDFPNFEEFCLRTGFGSGIPDAGLKTSELLDKTSWLSHTNSHTHKTSMTSNFGDKFIISLESNSPDCVSIEY